MSEGSGWTAGKIVLVVVAGLFVLGLVCCGVSAFVLRGPISSGIQMVQVMNDAGPRLEAQITERFPPGTVWNLAGDNPEAMTFTIGLPTAPAPQDIEELQDEAWRAYVGAFPDAGFPLGTIGVGVANGESGDGHMSGFVKDWHDNAVSAEVVEERTGVAAPPVLDFIEMIVDANKNENVTIEVNAGTDGDASADGQPDEDRPDEDQPADE